MNQSISKQFIIGLPSAGKTTFLAALWHVVETREVRGSLVLDHLDGDHSYLNDIRDLWADSKKLPRNKIADEHIVSMHLLNPRTNNITEVFFPDLSGESFQLQWTDRRIEENHLMLIKEASGGLLFLQPEHVIPETLISETNNIVNRIKDASQNDGDDAESKLLVESIATDKLALNDNIKDELSDNNKEALLEEEYDARNAPTQVQLVDLLQVVSNFNTSRPIKIAVIVSAWDLIHHDVQPIDWVTQHLPLLYQYLSSNEEVFKCNYFGISAQGGPLEDASRLRKHIKPSDKIKVIHNDTVEDNDITSPVRWVMEQ